MSVDAAKAFLKELAKDKDLQKKMSGFTLDELKEAATASQELSDGDLENVAGGYSIISV